MYIYIYVLRFKSEGSGFHRYVLVTEVLLRCRLHKLSSGFG